ncbi:MAG TPA: hypothetical protein VF601_03440 [Beijerinckiaceae bacterium]|jgi:hypothetical protein
MSLLVRTIVALALALAAAPALATPGDEACKRDLFMADAAISGSYRNLEMGGAKPEEQCAAWRRHVEALRRASAAYGRCAVGPARAKTAEFDGSAADFRRLIGERCKGK